MKFSHRKQFAKNIFVSILVLFLMVSAMPCFTVSAAEELINTEELSEAVEEAKEPENALSDSEEKPLDSEKELPDNVVGPEEPEAEPLDPEMEGSNENTDSFTEDSIDPIDEPDNSIAEVPDTDAQTDEPEGNIGEAPEQAKPVPVKRKSEGEQELTVHVILDTSGMVVEVNRNDGFLFEVNGQEQQYDYTTVTETAPTEFDAKLSVKLEEGQTITDVPVKLIEIVNSKTAPTADFNLKAKMTIIGQKYDAEQQTLTVYLGRKVYFNITNIKPLTYNDYPSAREAGFQFGVFSADGNLLSTSEEIYDTTEYPYKFNSYCLEGLVPGDYTVKILSMPENFKDYNQNQTYKLRINSNALAQFELYQSDGDYHFTNNLGAYSAPPLYFSYKSPFMLLLPKNTPAQKFVSLQGIDKQEIEIVKDDIVEFKIKKTISADHNAVLYFHGSSGDYMNIGTYVDESFTDVLDKNLEYVPESLKLTLDDKLLEDPANDEFEAHYDSASRSIVVNDKKTKPTIIPVDYGTTAVLPASKELVVRFQVKVLDASDTIYNTVDKSTVELIPFKIEGHKIWQDQGNKDNKRPESITVWLLANGEKKLSQTVSAKEEWSWSFTNLPRLDVNGNPINYAVQEEAVDYYKTEVDGYDITNTYEPPETPPTTPDTPPTTPPDTPPTTPPGTPPTTPPTESPHIDIPVKVTVKKLWEDQDNQAGLRPDKVTVRLYADGKDTGKVIFLEPERGWAASFWELPAYDGGHKIEYTVQEEPVAYYESRISGDMVNGFVVTNTLTGQPPTELPEKAKDLPRTGENSSQTLWLSLALIAAGLALIVEKKND